MTFDLYFVRLASGETWQDAMDRLEEARSSPTVLTDADIAQWNSVRAHVSPLLLGAEEFAAESHRELSEDTTGIQISLSPGELSLSAPYWHSGSEAEALVERLRAIVASIEDATGLVAYDPQADAAFLDTGHRTAAATFDQVDSAFRKASVPGSEAEASERSGLLKRMFRRSP